MEQIIKKQKINFWNYKKFHDISFTFPNSNESLDKVLNANKVILAQVSPVFEAMFFGELAEKRNPIPIPDVDPYIFEVFLSFIYTAHLPVDDFMEVQQLYYVANKYEVTSIEAACKEFLTRNMTKYNLQEVLDFTEMFCLQDLSRLCRLYMSQYESKSGAHWMSFDRTRPLPEGFFIADYESNGWPLGVARVNNIPGTFYVKEMKACIGHWAESSIHTEHFDVLCGMNLEWVKSSNGKKLDKSVVAGGFAVGKTMDNNEVHIGRVEERDRCLNIFYKSGGGTRLYTDYYHLIDTFTEVPELTTKTYCLQNVHQDVSKKEFELQLRHDRFWANERFEDICFKLTYNGNSQQFKVNKMVMAQISPVFEALIETTQDQLPISINGVDFKSFEALLKFIYTRVIEISSVSEIETLLQTACTYEIFCIRPIFEKFLMKNPKNFPVSELSKLAEKFKMHELFRLCKLHEENKPQINIPARWIPWKLGDPLPSGTFFADYDKDGWPIGVALFNEIPGTLCIKDMLARNGTGAVAYENRTEFKILCDGNLEWILTSDGVTLPQSVIASWQFCVGKCKQDGEMYIGKVQAHHKCMYITFQQGESDIYKNYFHLIDKNCKNKPKSIYYGF